MDYRALAELVMLGSFGLATLVFVAGLSIRLFLAPTLRELFGRGPNPEAEQKRLKAHLAQIEDRLAGLEISLERFNAAEEFDRKLERSKLLEHID